MTTERKPHGYYTDKVFTPADMDKAIAAEREACAYRAGIALLGADRGLANRVDHAIRTWGQA